MSFFGDDDSSFGAPSLDPASVIRALNDDTKQVIKILSSDKQDVTPHMVCENPLGSIDEASQGVREATAVVAQHTSEEYYNFFDLLDVTEPMSDEVARAITEFTKVLTHQYIPVNVKERQGPIATTYVAPFLGFLNSEVPLRGPSYRVLVLGAGVGKDVRRFLTRISHSLLIVAVEPSRKDYNILMNAYPEVIGFNCTVAQCIKNLRKYGPYDFVVANMSVHYILGVPSHVDFVAELPFLLAPHGLFFGSYVDTTSVKLSGIQQYLKKGHSVVYVCENHLATSYGERPMKGTATVSVAGVLWEDPIIDTQFVYDAFSTSPLALNVFDGHTILFGPEKQGPIYKSLEFLTNTIDRPELSHYRCIIASHPNKPDRGKFTVPRSLDHSTQVMPCDLVPLTHFNKGKPLQPYESQYVDPKLCWIADKKDGVMAKLSYAPGCLLLITVNDVNYTIPDFVTTVVSDSFCLQIELVSTTNNSALHVGGGHWWIVVTDVLWAPYGPRGSFISRWSWLQHIYDKIDWPFVLQDWARLDDERAFVILRDSVEGVVLQSLTAPPGPMRKGAGSARYVKRRYTIDVEQNDRIVEVDAVSGVFIRNRPDKRRPNPPTVVRAVLNAVCYSDFVIYVFQSVVGTIGGCLPTIMRNVSLKLPLCEWDIEDVMWSWRHRHEYALNELVPGLLDFITVAFPIQAHRDSQPLMDAEVAAEACPPTSYSDDVTYNASDCTIAHDAVSWLLDEPIISTPDAPVHLPHTALLPPFLLREDYMFSPNDIHLTLTELVARERLRRRALSSQE